MAGDEQPLFAAVNRELYKRNAELAVRNKTLALLRKLDEISMSAVGIDEMARRLSEAIAAELGYEVVSLSVVEGSGKNRALRWIAIASPIPDITTALQSIPPRSLVVPARNTLVTVGALRRKQATIATTLPSVFPRPLVRALSAHQRPERALKSSLVYPLRLGREVLGALTLSANRNLRELTRYERESIAGLVGLVALALYKAQIYERLQQTTVDLREANAQLANLDKAKSEFLSIASHQLYSPLTSLKGYLSLIQEGAYGAVSDKLRPIHQNLRESSDRLIDLIRNLLDVSRIESGRLEISPELIDLVAMARGLVTELAPNAQRKQLTLAFEEPKGTVPHVVGDAQRLRQVLLNTLDNAIKYTDLGRVDVSVTVSDSSLVYTVKDTGKGMSPGDLQRIFGKFTRVGGAERYHTEGSGLGLYVARLIVREHHGDIWAESEGEGKGSTMFVKLPVEGSKDALKVGQNIIVGIKAAETGEKPDETDSAPTEPNKKEPPTR